MHLIDGTFELFRAYYGAPPASAPDGREVGATRSLARQLLVHVEKQEATHVAVAFDHVIAELQRASLCGGGSRAARSGGCA